MKQINFQFPVSGFRLFLLLGLMVTRAALGTIPAYTNSALVFYDGTPADTQPSDFNPMIDAANFVNNSYFMIENGTIYQTWNTTNFINNSIMEGDYGFFFDLHTANQMPDVWASSFYNPGQIYCYDALTVWATNIVNPGVIEIDSGILGGVQLLGKNVDLTRATISMPGGASAGGQIFYHNPTVGAITNSWTPSVNLAMPYPYTPMFRVAPGFSELQLFNPVVYANDTGPVNSNRVVQVVYISQPNPAITNNVSFDPTPRTGGITVQFSGTYTDATGLITTNYLVIFDNFGETTNLQLTGTAPYLHPINYNIFESSSPVILTPPPLIGLPLGIYGNGSITNVYSYVLANFSPTTMSTNDVAYGSVTNLPAHLQVTADNLNLTLANISGLNYLSLTATTNFQGNGGAQIVSPFADLNLAVTNGFLTISNLLAPSIPVWDGQCYLWSARWTNFDASIGVTNNFHVLFVDSPSLAAYSPLQVQNLALHVTNNVVAGATNSLVISDALNVFGSFYSDAQSLTLTTNGYGNGAESVDGELNLENNAIFWQSSLPNLLWLTNNGAITTMNLALFGSDAPTYTTNITPAIAATGTLSETATNANVPATNTVTIGTYKYVFANTITNAVPNQVKIGATFDGSMSNLITAINNNLGSGINYSTNTTTNTLVTAGLLTSHSFAVTARTAGTNGNSIVTTTSTTNLTWNATTNLTWNGSNTLSGGVAAIVVTNVAGGPYVAFINNGLLSDQGSQIWANDFENYGTFYSGNGSFSLQSLTTTLAGGELSAGGNISITTGTLLASNLFLFAGGALNLTAASLLTDGGVTNNGNEWQIGSMASSASPGMYFNNGFNLPNNPANGDLLGTTVYSIAPSQFVLSGFTNNNVLINNLWAGTDYGPGPSTTAGYTNNVAIGCLILDAQGANSTFSFTGTGVSNAIYVDELVLLDYASYTNHDTSGNLSAFVFNPNLVIYYADATIAGGVDVSAKLNHKNTNHFRWVSSYAGYFSGTNIVYPDGTTVRMNVALAQSATLDSNGSGTNNASNPTPLFVSSQMDFKETLTNNPSPAVRLTWNSIPSATNTVEYSTNRGNWLVLTNFVSPTNVPPVGGWPIMNTVVNPVTKTNRFYRVRLDQNSTQLYGPGF